MRFSEAIFIFERIRGLNAPLTSINDYDSFELLTYLLGQKKQYSKHEIEKAQELLTIKLLEYERDIERSNAFTEKYGNITGGKQEEDFSIIKYLTELTYYLAKIGISNIHDLSVYEAHRLFVIANTTKEE